MTGKARNPERYLPLTPIAFEILIAVAEGERHGYDVMLAIERRTGGRLSPNPGTLYRAIDRLVHEGLLETTTRIDTSDSEPRKLFRLSRLGARVAAAEAGRLADQVGAARRLLKRLGDVS
jgi:DNA-binding PadR family transcriptional regulator